jgi:phage shock protein E
MSIGPWVVAAVAVAVALVVRSRLLGGRKVSSDTVRQKITAGAVILDVRTADEYRGGAYPGAINIPVQELPARLGELPKKDRPIVVYCASGVRSASAAGALARAGFTDVVNAGGLRSMPG